KIIEKVPLFRAKGVTKTFISAVVMNLVPRVTLPGAKIVTRGEIGREMYFISSGTVEVIGQDDETVVATLVPGNFFGEIALIYNTKRTATVRAKTYCDLYVFTKESFDKIAKDFPEQVKSIR